MKKTLDKIIKYGLYCLVFLLPIFFLPWTVFPVALNKQMLLAVFVLLLFILWLVKVISSGRLSFVWNRLGLAILFLLLVFGISTFLSSSFVQSFWGMAAEADTFFNFILLVLVFFLFANLIKKEELKMVLVSFLASSGVLALLFLIQAFWPVFPWDFAREAGFNSVGSVQEMAVFLVGAFVVLIAFLTGVVRKSCKILGGILGILLFAAILLINLWTAWLGLAIGLAVVIFRMLKKLSPASSVTGVNPLKPLFLPLFVFVLALIFIFVELPIGNLVDLPAEITPTYKATLDISVKTLGEGTKNLVFGSGPATFAYQYSLHRGTGPNLTDFWQLRFGQGTAAAPTFLATTGILGILALFLVMLVFFWQGFRTVFRSAVPEPGSFDGFPLLLGGFYFLILWFFYSVNLSLLFVAFLMLGLWTAYFGKTKEFFFTQSPQKAFMIMLLGVILIVGSGFGLYIVSQKYIGAVVYAKGLSLINAETPKLDEGMASFNKAINLDQKDIYFRDLSQVFLLKIDEILDNSDLSQEEKQTLFQQVVSNAELSTSVAVQLNPKNSYNWFQLGVVYENLALTGVQGAEELAILNYQKSQELDPQNPQISLNIGRVYKLLAERNRAQITFLESAEGENEEIISKFKESFDVNLEIALEQFNKTAELKPNFSAAYYLAAQTYELKGDKGKALENYQLILQFEPDNEEIQEKVEELRD
jgi:tetratricopeptide (TPR) repeat protein